MSENQEFIQNEKREETIKELIEGYKNTQELIRFMDTKAGAVVIISGLLLTPFINFMEHFTLTSCVFVNTFLFLTIIAFIGVLTKVFISVAKCIKANGPIQESPLPHLLFPIGNTDKFCDFEKQLQSMNENHQLEELTAQIFNVGKILERKFVFCNKAIMYLKIQFLTEILIFFIYYLKPIIGNIIIPFLQSFIDY